MHSFVNFNSSATCASERATSLGVQCVKYILCWNLYEYVDIAFVRVMCTWLLHTDIHCTNGVQTLYSHASLSLSLSLKPGRMSEHKYSFSTKERASISLQVKSRSIDFYRKSKILPIALFKNILLSKESIILYLLVYSVVIKL